MASVRQQSPLVKPRVDGEERFGPPMGQWVGSTCQVLVKAQLVIWARDEKYGFHCPRNS